HQRGKQPTSAPSGSKNSIRDLIPERIKHHHSSRYLKKWEETDAFAKAIAENLRELQRTQAHQLYFVSLTYKESLSVLPTTQKVTKSLKEFYKTVLIPLLVHR